MPHKKSLLVFILLLGFSIPSAFAVPSPWINKQPYAEKIGGKLGFAVLNLGTGWTSLFFEPVFIDGWKGFGRGIYYTITNTAGGALHAVTFPFPFDIPLPNGGVQFYNKADK